MSINFHDNLWFWGLVLQPKDESEIGKEIVLECPDKQQMQIKCFLSLAVQ